MLFQFLIWRWFLNGLWWWADDPAAVGTGAAGDEDDPEDDPGTGSGDGDEDEDEDEADPARGQTLRLTQAQLNAMIGQRAQRAGQAAQAAVLERLNVGSLDELEELVSAERERREAEMGEVERLQSQLTQAQQEAQQAQAAGEAAIAQANERLMRAEVMAEASAQGFEHPEDVWRVLDRSQITVNEAEGDEGEVTFAGIKAAVTKLAKDRPGWLTRSARSGGHGTPGGSSGRGTGTSARPEGQDGERQRTNLAEMRRRHRSRL